MFYQWHHQDGKWYKHTTDNIKINKFKLILSFKFKNKIGYQKIDVQDIYYFESVDERSYVYTKDNVYECKEKLYTIEETFKNTSIVRVSKSCILNITKLKSVRPFINGKFEATMLSNEKIIINRHYVSAFKKKFNI